MRQVNTKYYIDAHISDDAQIDCPKSSSPDFKKGIWYSGVHIKGDWFGKGIWLNGTWIDGVLWLKYGPRYLRHPKMSPKSYFRPQKTIALNYAMYS